MRRISYGVNSYSKKVNLEIDFAPVWIFALENLSDFICGHLIPALPLPKIRLERDGEKTTLREYYGDLQQVFHVLVHNPLFQYCYRHRDSRTVELDYETARKAFYDRDKKFWDEAEKRAEEMEEADRKEADSEPRLSPP